MHKKRSPSSDSDKESNPCDRHVHNSLSNVVIHMRRVNIHRAGHYQLEMVFLQLDVRLPPIAMDNTLHRFDCI